MNLTPLFTRTRDTARLALCTSLLVAAAAAQADAVTDWNLQACQWVAAAGLVTQPASRVMAISHTAAFEAANAITRRYPGLQAAGLSAPPGASVDAAIAAAHHATLGQLLPTQQPAITLAYRKALAAIADGQAKDEGVAVGERAAQQLLARRADDGANAVETYRPLTTPGRWVATTIPSTPQWPQRTPWLMSSAAQFRPGPPPALDSERWARDYNEIKALGARQSKLRTPEQTDIARFWTTTLPAIYHGVVRGVAEQPGRDTVRNARLYAAVTQAIDDGMIAVFDAKYHHGFWRPITAIRNGDTDGNAHTERDPSWLPLIDTPMHPEYPCAHCIQAAAVGAVLQAEIGSGPVPMLSTTSVSANGALRQWPGVHAFVREVGHARIYGGAHFRFSTEVGLDMGQRIGALAVQRLLAE
ncbi:vanadium-dependent haloperoxidase [Ideonella sp. BN130291]|uniref:vanadium-dependent haloperoxidase n=1 Tax=Ideonella sp. BN130291 TaxID=3112940 RepID=UPI002E277267|nr:vanadium-dependent haloperoxidase [Ideonella sp. BN130291]